MWHACPLGRDPPPMLPIHEKVLVQTFSILALRWGVESGSRVQRKLSVNAMSIPYDRARYVVPEGGSVGH